MFSIAAHKLFWNGCGIGFSDWAVQTKCGRDEEEGEGQKGKQCAEGTSQKKKDLHAENQAVVHSKIHKFDTKACEITGEKKKKVKKDCRSLRAPKSNFSFIILNNNISLIILNNKHTRWVKIKIPFNLL